MDMSHKVFDAADKVTMTKHLTVIIELPTNFHTPGGQAASLSGALLKLGFTAGAIAGACQTCVDRVHMIPVNMWKGQLPKQLTTKRVNKKYKLSLNWMNKENNEADAIALGDWWITKGRNLGL